MSNENRYFRPWGPQSGADLAHEMGVTPEDVQLRQAFVDLGAEDIRAIASIAPIVEAFAEPGVDTFFEHLQRFPQSRALFDRPETLRRARDLKLSHLLAMTSGSYDVAYAQQRLELASLYSQVNLDPRVFLGAFHHLMQAIGRRVVRAYQHEPELGFQRFMSFKKVAFFDIGLIVDALVFERERTIRLQQLALRSIGDGVIATDTRGRVTLLNPVAEAMTGWPEAAALGQGIHEVFPIVHSRTRATARNPVDEALGTGAIVGLANSTALVARDGSERLIADSAAPIRDAQGRIVGAVLVFRDVTEKERIEAELQRATTLESLGVLAGGIAHDFNNMLTGMLANISMARVQAYDAALVRTRLADAENAALRARDLTRQLLTFAKGGAPMRQPTQLGPLVEEWVRFTLAGSNVRATVRGGPNAWTADVDASQIGQVVQNLVMNAQQAMPNGGDLRVSLTNVVLSEPTGLPIPGGRYLRVEIADHGVGIEPHVLPRVFDPFFTTKAKGSGLGLASAYSIVKKHDGHISVSSEPGRGTTVVVYLPASEDVGSSPHIVHPAAGDRRGKVLLMDDDDVIRGAAVQMLALLGYRSVATASGEEAIAAYREALDRGEPFDAVILDLTVPGGMGGVPALREIRAFDPSVRAIVSSGYSADPVLARYQDHGFVDVVPKPYSMEELATVLGRVVGAGSAALRG
jgi:two-component system cell cycle sensor histidine kinase/response regulator CckA